MPSSATSQEAAASSANSPEPSVSNEPTAPASTPVPQSTAQEEATVEAKIEDFVAGATEEATPPASGPASDAVGSTNPATEPDSASPTPPPQPPDTTGTSNAADDDNLMDQAVETLAASTEINEAEPETSETNLPPVQPEPQPVSEMAATPETTNPGSVPIAHKKVIIPLDGEPKKDISTLLALEEAKQASSQPAAPPTAVVATNEAGGSEVPLAAPPDLNSAAPTDVKPAPPEAKGSAIDPGSIAL